jgi:hypothetical protein
VLYHVGAVGDTHYNPRVRTFTVKGFATELVEKITSKDFDFDYTLKDARRVLVSRTADNDFYVINDHVDNGHQFYIASTKWDLEIDAAKGSTPMGYVYTDSLPDKTVIIVYTDRESGKEKAELYCRTCDHFGHPHFECYQTPNAPQLWELNRGLFEIVWDACKADNQKVCTQIVKNMPLKPVDKGGSGDCFYRSMAFAMYGDADANTQWLRDQVCEYYKEHGLVGDNKTKEERETVLTTKDKDGYAMKDARYFAQNLDIQVFCERFNARVDAYTSRQHNTEFDPENNLMWLTIMWNAKAHDKPFDWQISIHNQIEVHYVPLLKEGDVEYDQEFFQSGKGVLSIDNANTHPALKNAFESKMRTPGRFKGGAGRSEQIILPDMKWSKHM